MLKKGSMVRIAQYNILKGFNMHFVLSLPQIA